MHVLSVVGRRRKLLGGLLSTVFAGCATAPKIESKPSVDSQVSADRDTAVVRKALARALVVPDSMIWSRIVFRGDTAWAMVTVDSLMSHRARLERRGGTWAFIRMDGTGVR